MLRSISSLSLQTSDISRRKPIVIHHHNQLTMGGTEKMSQIFCRHFVKDNTLNELLNETAQGDTNTQVATAPINDPFSAPGALPVENLPNGIANVVNRDYRGLMKAIEKKKGKL